MGLCGGMATPLRDKGDRRDATTGALWGTRVSSGTVWTLDQKVYKHIEAWHNRPIEETLTFHRFPDNHWVRIRTHNPMERIIREIRGRTRVVGAFPDGQSAVMHCAARLRHIAGTKWGTRRYQNMEPLFKQALRTATA